MTQDVDVFWSFRSPYSYLATPDLLRLRDDYDVNLRFRPVLPIAVRANQAALDASGHWGVPTMVFEGEPFFGQDRNGTLRWRLGTAGLSTQ